MFLKNKEWQILTPNGWSKFDGIKIYGQKETVDIITTARTLTSTPDHKWYVDNCTKVEAKDLKYGDKLLGKSITPVLEVKPSKKQLVYDFINVEKNNWFYANDIISSNCTFVGESGTLIDSMKLTALTNSIMHTEPHFIQDICGEKLRFYKDIEPGKKYIISLDFSVGTVKDYTVMNIWEFPGFIQIADWSCNKKNQNEQSKIIFESMWWFYEKLKEVGDTAPEIYWSFENNSWAEGFIGIVNEKGGFGIFPGELVSEPDSNRPGIEMNKKNRPLGTSNLKSLIESDRMIVKSPLLVQQLNFFVNVGGKFQAKVGENDDAVMSAVNGIMVYLLKKQDLTNKKNYSAREAKQEIDNTYVPSFAVSWGI